MNAESDANHNPASGRTRWFRFTAICLPLIVLAIFDLTLRATGPMPPEDPLLFYAKTYQRYFSPFVQTTDGKLTIKPDWVLNTDDIRADPSRRSGRLFLHPGFRPCTISKNKPPRTTRIFVLGGSTVFGQQVHQSQTFAALLQQKLQATTLPNPVQVINLGCPGWASSRIRNALDTVLDLQPDMIIVYSGHNELLKGHVDAELQLGPLWQIRRTILSASILCRWADYLYKRYRDPAQLRLAQEQVRAIKQGKTVIFDALDVPHDQQHLPDPDFLNAAGENYARNLRAIAQQCRRADVPLVLIMPLANLWHQPQISAHDGSFDQQQALNKLLLEADRLSADGQLDQALTVLDQAIELSPHYALAYYKKGQLLWRQQQTKAAREALTQARDLDVRTHRITSPLESVLVDTAQNTGVKLIDLRAIYAQNIRHPQGMDLFMDHCHPTAYGHQLIADHIAPTVIEMLHSK